MKEPLEEVIEEAYEEEMLAEEAWPAYPEAYLEKHQKSLRQTRKKKSFSGSSLSFGLAPGLANPLQQGQRPSLSSWLPQEGSVYAQSWELFFHQKRLGGSPFWLRYGLAWDYQSIDFGKHALIQVLPSPGWMSGELLQRALMGYCAKAPCRPTISPFRYGSISMEAQKGTGGFQLHWARMVACAWENPCV